MHYYLKGYYGYKNFGDELLLLGVITYLSNELQMTVCTIETPDPVWLKDRLDRHSEYFPTLTIHYAATRFETIKRQMKCDAIVIGGGEVITDSRSFPHNGWNYLLRNYRLRIFGKKIFLLGGFGTPLHFGSRFLYWMLYTYASKIICRESASYERVCSYVSSDKVLLHEDFSYTILKQIKSTPSKNTKNYAIVNCNPYIRSKETKETIVSYCHNSLFEKCIYFPAELIIDAPMFAELCEGVPNIERFDRTQHSLQEIAECIQHASGGIAARLHVLILLAYWNIPYTPLVYQEKITKILGHA